MPAILDKFVSKEAQNSTYHVYVTSLRRTRNWREGEKPATDLASFTRSAKSISFQAIIHFTIFNATISEFGECLAQNNMAQEQP